MRYVIAIIFAVVAGLFVAAQYSTQLTSGILAGTKFQSPDQVEDMHAMLMIGFALLGAVGGWIVGWLVGGIFDRSPRATPIKRNT
jgi:membrane associated rhomboid family serine protease